MAIVYFPYLGLYSLAYIRPHLVRVIFTFSNIQRLKSFFIGDDCIAVKIGWDQYGIKFGMPTQDLIIRRLTCISPDSIVVALGSEMSGGIKNVRAENITTMDSQSGVRIKTAVGRGAYVKDVYVRRMNIKAMK